MTSYGTTEILLIRELRQLGEFDKAIQLCRETKALGDLLNKSLQYFDIEEMFAVNRVSKVYSDEELSNLGLSARVLSTFNKDQWTWMRAVGIFEVLSKSNDLEWLVLIIKNDEDIATRRAATRLVNYAVEITFQPKNLRETGFDLNLLVKLSDTEIQQLTETHLNWFANRKPDCSEFVKFALYSNDRFGIKRRRVKNENPRIIEILLEAIKDDDYGVRCLSATALGWFTDPIVVPHLNSLLNDPHLDVVKATVDSLNFINNVA